MIRPRSSHQRQTASLLLVVPFAAVLLFFAAPRMTSARPQISPGELSKPHQSLSGATNCTKCHDLGRGARVLKCLDCHTEIRQRLAERRGLHASFLAAHAAGAECAQCHSEHNGADFQLVHWQPSREAFDHSKAGYVLEGRHAGVSCENCHKADNIPQAARPGIIVKDLNHTYLGLPRNCTACHRDEHRGQLASDCARCHTLETWKPAARFRHSAAKFPLTGAHEKVPCRKCHPLVPDPKPYAQYVGLSFEKCTACHTDPHKGSFAAPCQSCHTTSSWKQVKGLEGFDHSKTNFPLLGKHRSVSCSDCHTKGDFKAPLPHARCMDCHRDAHRSQFKARADAGECSACHTVEGFKPSTLGVKEHAATNYPLQGKHQAVVCAKCHIPKGEDTLFKITATSCKDCHRDVHNGQFAAPPHLNRCESCHDVEGFRPSHFALARHKETRFPLTGAHAAVTCEQCHKPLAPGSTDAVKYRFEDRSCSACHSDPHRGEFRALMEARRPDGTVAGCEACHSTATWKRLTRFDHSATRFPLLGAHRGVECVDCHRPPNLARSLRNVDYRAAPKQCSGCHADHHAGQFAARKEVSDCSSCHDSARWKPSQFDHDRRTPFPLEGAHRLVPCAGCHKQTRTLDGRTVVFYKPTPRECKACHGAA